MASIRAQGSAYEIRECRSTDRGPRQVALARFRDALTPEVLDEAQARARRPFDRQALIERARRRGIPFSARPRSRSARRLLAEVRDGRTPDPALVTLLQQALAALDAHPLPEHLHEVADWIGQSEAARGKALRGLLRTASRVRLSTGPRREPERECFPRFRSAREAA